MTSRSDEPVIRPAFLPKDKDAALRMIAEILYGRLELATDPDEIQFLRNLLNVIECS